MKKTVSVLILAVLFVLLACSCKSEAAKSAINLISAIGEVSLDSNDAITAAEAAVAGLDEKDRKQVNNLDVLTKARSTYEQLVAKDLQSKIAIVENAINAIGPVTLESEPLIKAAREAYNNSDLETQKGVSNYNVLVDAESNYEDAVYEKKAEPIEAQIAAIGTVTLESKTVIEAVRSEYRQASIAVQKHVDNYNILVKAEEEYKDLVESGKVVDAIAAIGDVTLNKETVINDANKAYEALNNNAKLKVSNYSILKSAIHMLAQLQQEQKENTIRELSGKMRPSRDDVRGITFYYHSRQPHYINERTYVFPYIGRRDNGEVWLCLDCNYYGDDWVFWKSLICNIDGSVTTKTVKYYDINHETVRGTVVESFNTGDVSSSDIKLLQRIANSTKTIIRFEGDHHSYDLTVSDSDKKAIREVLALYEAWGGK